MGILLLHMTTSPKSRTDGFFDEWSIYDEVLACNAMHHDEIFADVRRFLAGCYGDRSFAILDLGCGSARHLARAVKGRSLSADVGYDLSDTALTHAKRNLADLGCPVDLRNGDLIEGVRNFRDRCDVIFSSFALHHLTSVRKMEFFASAYRRLKRDGICLVIDTMRDDGEDLSTYLDRYCAWLRKRCPSLPEAALEHLFTHVRTCDFPENEIDLEGMTARAGFAPKTEISRYHWHRAWCLRKVED